MKTLALLIPTHNRSKFLEKVLKNIEDLFVNYKADILVIISDNASIDDTGKIVKKFMDKNLLEIIYLKNEKNVGYDLNVFKLYKYAQNKAYYGWILSDDDLIKYNINIDFIIELLIKNNISLLKFMHQMYIPKNIRDEDIYILDNYFEYWSNYTEKFTIFSSYISQCIFKLNQRNIEQIEKVALQKTNLIQMFMFYESLLLNKNSIAIYTDLPFKEQENLSKLTHSWGFEGVLFNTIKVFKYYPEVFKFDINSHINFQIYRNLMGGGKKE